MEAGGAGVICPDCGVELEPRDAAGLPLVAEHAPGCTAMADAAAEASASGEGDGYGFLIDGHGFGLPEGTF